MTDLQRYQEKYENDRFFQEVFRNLEYGPAMDRGSVDTVLDVGALAGEFSFWIYPNASVIYAFEPEERSFEELKGNIKEYGFDKVKPFRIALAGENGRKSLRIQSRGGHTLDEGGDNTQEVDTRTLASFMKEHNIEKVDILKIDIENGENAVFKADDFDEVAGKIRFIIGEHLENLQEHFSSYGFEVLKHKQNLIFKK